MPARRDSGSELDRVLRRIRELTFEVGQLRTRPGAAAELEVKLRALDRLRWRLAAVARCTATQALDDAA